MRRFLKLLLGFTIPILFLFILGLVLPATPRASKSLLFAYKKKDSLLENTKEPRIIFIGGSNLSFGLNSYAVKDALGVTPVNTAVHGNIGVRYFLENSIGHIKSGDIIIMSFEYEYFYKTYDYTSEELLRMVFDVNKDNWRLLSLKQKIGLLKYVPKYSLSKFKPKEYFSVKENQVYSVNSFNDYGDAVAHWDLGKQNYEPYTITGNYNEEVVAKIKEFETKAKIKGAKVYITYPCIDEIAYKRSEVKINEVEKALRTHNFNIIGTPREFCLPMNMMFNTSYHLNKAGVDYRTNTLIKEYLIVNNKYVGL